PFSLRLRADDEHAGRILGGWRERKAELPRKHADREAAPRVCHRSHRPLRGRLGREVGHALVLCDRPREWRAQTGRTLSHRQGCELGRDRCVRLGYGCATVDAKTLGIDVAPRSRPSPGTRFRAGVRVEGAYKLDMALTASSSGWTIT